VGKVSETLAQAAAEMIAPTRAWGRWSFFPRTSMSVHCAYTCVGKVAIGSPLKNPFISRPHVRGEGGLGA